MLLCDPIELLSITVVQRVCVCVTRCYTKWNFHLLCCLAYATTWAGSIVIRLGVGVNHLHVYAIDYNSPDLSCCSLLFVVVNVCMITIRFPTTRFCDTTFCGFHQGACEGSIPSRLLHRRTVRFCAVPFNMCRCVRLCGQFLHDPTQQKSHTIGWYTIST